MKIERKKNYVIVTEFVCGLGEVAYVPAWNPIHMMLSKLPGQSFTQLSMAEFPS